MDTVAFCAEKCFAEDVIEAFGCSAYDEVAIWFCEH